TPAAGTGGLGGATGGEARETVGRWMSQEEHDAMVATGMVQQSRSGGPTNVLSPPNPAAYKDAPSGSLYLQFNVPASSLRGKSAGQTIIPGPNSPHSRAAVKQGLPALQMPPATNIKIMGRK